MEKYGRLEQATDDNIIRCTHITCWMDKATGIHSEFVILSALPRQNIYVQAPQFHVILTLPVLLKTLFHST